MLRVVGAREVQISIMELGQQLAVEWHALLWERAIRIQVRVKEQIQVVICLLQQEESVLGQVERH